MNFFTTRCDRCGNTTSIGAGVPCMHLRKDGTICGFSAPIDYENSNRYFQKKAEKHTNPFSGYGGWHSHASSGQFFYDQQLVMSSGGVYFDCKSHSLILAAPVYPGSDAQVWLSGVQLPTDKILMPVLEKIQNLHHHYSASGVPLHYIIGYPVTIEMPSKSRPTFRVLQSGRPVCELDKSGSSGLTFF